LSLCIQPNKGMGMVSIDDIYYEAYNNDFGPLTINDLLCLAQ